MRVSVVGGAGRLGVCELAESSGGLVIVYSGNRMTWWLVPGTFSVN